MTKPVSLLDTHHEDFWACEYAQMIRMGDYYFEQSQRLLTNPEQHFEVVGGAAIASMYYSRAALMRQIMKDPDEVRVRRLQEQPRTDLASH
jgi:hypothetical protein